MSLDPAGGAAARRRLYIELLAAMGREAGFEEQRFESRADRGPSVAHWFETTTVDLPGTGAGFWILTLNPGPEVSALWELGQVDEAHWARAAARRLGILGQPDVPAELLLAGMLATRPDQAPTYTALPLRTVSSEKAQAPPETEEELAEFGTYVSRVEPRLVSFAARIATEPLVPVERSAPTGVSLNQIVNAGSASAVLGYAGATDRPLLVVAVPVAIVVIGAAQGVAGGLQEGLHRRVVKWVTGEDPSEESSEGLPDDGDGGPGEP
jgi:hypothetical protein